MTLSIITINNKNLNENKNPNENFNKYGGLIQSAILVFVSEYALTESQNKNYYCPLKVER